MTTSQQANQPNSTQNPKPIHINNECYFLLSEEHLYELERINGVLQFVHSLLWQCRQNADFNLTDLGDVLAYPADSLFEILKELNSSSK